MNWTAPRSIEHRLPPGWQRARFWDATRLEGQLARECRNGHPLHRAKCRALARDGASDDVLFERRGGNVLLVHLIWAKTPAGGWPAFTEFTGLDDALASLNTEDSIGDLTDEP